MITPLLALAAINLLLPVGVILVILNLLLLAMFFNMTFSRRRGPDSERSPAADTQPPVFVQKFEQSLEELESRQRIISNLVQNAILGEDLSYLLETAITDIATNLNLELCCILELKPESQEFFIRVCHGADFSEATSAHLSASSDSPPGGALQRVTPLVIEDIHKSYPQAEFPCLEMKAAKSGVFVVIDGSEDPYGVLCAYSAHLRLFSKDEIYFLQIIANLLANSLQQEKSRLALQQSEERLALAAAGSNDGLWDWDIINEKVYYSSRWKAIFGRENEVLDGTMEDWFSRVNSSHLAQLTSDIELHLSGNTAQLNNEHCIVTRDGTERWVLCRGVAVRDENDTAVRIAGSLTDITARKEIERKLRHAAHHDILTGLANRASLLQRIDLAIKRAQRDVNCRFAVLFLDFDRFKIVNDSLGHDVGDLLLKSIAKRLGTDLRNVDLVARLGGDEFVILLDGLEAYSDCTLVAERLLENLAVPHLLNGNEITSTASIGIVTNENNYVKAEDVLRDADTAMYHAKEAGRAQYVIFDEKMRKEAIMQQVLEVNLRKVIERDELLLHYQPIIILETGHVTGFEALVRWRKSDGTLIGPDKFIPIAEETGLIVPIGEWVIREACRQLHAWHTQFPDWAYLTMNINLSRRQISQPRIVETICDILTETGVSPSSIKLEITESVIMDDRINFATILQSLSDQGISLCMDDFGTGHSSLSCLHNFPLDVLKIDRSFIHNLTANTEFSAIIHSIIALAHNLKISVVAEGIETAEQLAHLQALECDEAQGFFFARPMAAADAAAFLTNYNTLRKSA